MVELHHRNGKQASFGHVSNVEDDPHDNYDYDGDATDGSLSPLQNFIPLDKAKVNSCHVLGAINSFTTSLFLLNYGVLSLWKCFAIIIAILDLLLLCVSMLALQLSSAFDFQGQFASKNLDKLPLTTKAPATSKRSYRGGRGGFKKNFRGYKKRR